MKHHDAAVNASGTSGKGINRKFNSLFGGSLYNLVTNANDVWDQRMEQVQLPLGVDIVMGDVHGGTNSPSMAKKVLLWKRENPVESAALYQELAGANSGVCASIKRLNKYAKLAGSSPNDAALYNAALLWCNTLPQDQWSTVTDEVSSCLVDIQMIRLSENICVCIIGLWC